MDSLFLVLTILLLSSSYIFTSFNTKSIEAELAFVYFLPFFSLNQTPSEKISGKMNGFDSESSSGCESGWTVYFEQSFRPPNASRRGKYFLGDKDYCFDNHGFGRTKEDEEEEEEEEEEDLSMVSDASSGPPHLHEAPFEDDNAFSYSASKPGTLTKNNGKRQKAKDNLIQSDSSFLDDTASSPVFDFSAKNCGNQASRKSSVDFSQGFSATHLEGRRRLQTHFDLLQSSASRRQIQRNPLG